ncbi:acireductone dioxygenase [Leptinotarsa decemlineata]|uniref:acireductone dioxygenase n=1 Tax=Leptinotarsa decemlineata TaxID=7539 RepID=UPI000C254D27|nr:1,2-dihydroxy-3-keto-5-methylthiopentene dioxygenase-like [Leptinotarsa decemlineata]
MVRAWFIDEDPKNPTEEHHRIPPKFIGLEEIYKTTGVEYFQIDPHNYKLDGTLRKLIDERDNRGQQILENLDANDLHTMYIEHYHTYEEFRLVLEGCCYYDIRDKFDEWIRMELLPGDLIIIPGGCYHRFTVDKQKIFKGVRILKDGVYQAHVRPSEKLNCRKDYVKKLYNGAFEQEPRDQIETGMKV